METANLIDFSDGSLGKSSFEIPETSTFSKQTISSLLNQNIDFDTSISPVLDDNIMLNFDGRESLGILNMNYMDNNDIFSNQNDFDAIKILNETRNSIEPSNIICKDLKNSNILYDSDSKFSFNANSLSTIDSCKIYSLISENSLSNNGIYQKSLLFKTLPSQSTYIKKDFARERIRSLSSCSMKPTPLLESVKEVATEGDKGNNENTDLVRFV